MKNKNKNFNTWLLLGFSFLSGLVGLGMLFSWGFTSKYPFYLLGSHIVSSLTGILFIMLFNSIKQTRRKK